ncbi:MAG: hypothetical protein DHS20C16_15110 [Phycisphaerae bacterium]|nr:MAG: hypothetical protein DHS20C16_15110 [Phycisphaerae bacterium]
MGSALIAREPDAREKSDNKCQLDWMARLHTGEETKTGIGLEFKRASWDLHCCCRNVIFGKGLESRFGDAFRLFDLSVVDLRAVIHGSILALAFAILDLFESSDRMAGAIRNQGILFAWIEFG